MRLRITPPTQLLLLLMAANLIWRFAFWTYSTGSYTDGILQIDCFRLGLSFWPPLFALLTRLVAWVPGLGLEQGGRVIATLCGTLTLWPLAAMARRLFGARAALWAMLAWTACPMALRWSLQPMTDTPFVLGWCMTLAAMLLAAEAYLPGLFPAMEPAQLPSARRGGQWLVLAGVAGTFATLTRFQGALLAPPLLALVIYSARVRKALAGAGQNSARDIGWSPLLALVPWVAFPAWLLRQGVGPLTNHFTQISDRAASTGVGATLLNYWLLFEEFAKQSPFFFGYGVFLFGVYGLLRTNWGTARLRWFGWGALYLTLSVLALQAVFSSFQERYLLPLLPLCCLWAGHGLATLERHAKGRRIWFWGLATPALLYGLVFGGLVARWQGGPFADLKQAAQWVAAHPPQGRVLTNEMYAKIVAPKVRFWSGLEQEQVRALFAEQPRAGDAIVLSSYDMGSREAYVNVRHELEVRLPARVVQRFVRRAVPLLPDIMENATFAQNPLALVMRYRVQSFETVVLEVLPKPAGAGVGAPAPGALQEAPPPLLMPKNEKIEKLNEELKNLGAQMNGVNGKANGMGEKR